MEMVQEDKELLLKDISGRLPYGLIVQISLFRNDGRKRDIDLDPHVTENIWELIDKYHARPYLRPMSSMTEEEWEELNCIGYIVPLYDGCFGVDMRAYCKNSQPHYRRFGEFSTIEDWLNAHHFDYRNLIGKGLAIEAPEGMYNIKEK